MSHTPESHRKFISQVASAHGIRLDGEISTEGTPWRLGFTPEEIQELTHEDTGYREWNASQRNQVIDSDPDS